MEDHAGAVDHPAQARRDPFGQPAGDGGYSFFGSQHAALPLLGELLSEGVCDKGTWIALPQAQVGRLVQKRADSGQGCRLTYPVH